MRPFQVGSPETAHRLGIERPAAPEEPPGRSGAAEAVSILYLILFLVLF